MKEEGRKIDETEKVQSNVAFLVKYNAPRAQPNYMYYICI